MRRKRAQPVSAISFNFQSDPNETTERSPEATVTRVFTGKWLVGSGGKKKNGREEEAAVMVGG